jgi:hypothetical protein
MRCCKKPLSNPVIVDGTAYFVCSECGEVREIENYQIYTTEEALSFFEEKHGFRLPKDYAKLSRTNKNKVVKLPACDKASLKFYFGEGFFVVGSFASIDPNDDDSIHKTVCSGREWGLPSAIVPIEGDGHTWLALDYSDSHNEPKVVVIETDDGNSLVVARNFKELISNLLRYEEVYDLDGKLIYGEEGT